VIVYVPPFGELRGGAWAVVDTKINPTCITMLADPDCRGGVLEPTGIVEIKFRERDLYQLMSRSDSTLCSMETALTTSTDTAQVEELQKSILKRREKLLPVTKPAAFKFADLHDTTARMLAKGAIHDEVSWKNARKYFYDLITVELAKMQMARQYLSATGVNANKIDIDALSVGYKWVTGHLQQTGVSTRRDVRPEERCSKRSRFFYVADEIFEYANSTAFQQVCDRVKQITVSATLSNLSSDVRRAIIIDQLGALSAQERKQLLGSIPSQKK